jgi:hypothetical protein
MSSSSENLATFLHLGRYGELGNQMFQIATTSCYAWKWKKKLAFPHWKCKISGRDYTKIFKNPVPQTADLENLRYSDLQYMDLKYIEIPNLESNVNFVGYFQSEKYFFDYKEEVKEMFQPSVEIETYIQEKYKDLLEIQNKVSLHIRTVMRSKSDSPQVHASASREFIEKSMTHFPEDSVFVVFADVMEEAKKLLPQNKQYIFIEGEENYVDLFLMTNFDSYIVSPSTFGWWGAWLSKSKSPKITVLKDWFIGSKTDLNDNDIVPERWIKISV